MPAIETLDHVGIERALAEKIGVPDRLERLFKHFDEGAADDLPLALGFDHALEPAQEKRAGVDDPEVDLEMPLVEGLDGGALPLAQEAVVDKDAGELSADRLVQQRGGHRGIHAPREAEQHAGLAHLGPDVGHGVRDEVLRRPVLLRLADAHQEIADHVHAALGVGHLGVELDAIEAALRVLNPGKGRIFRDGRGHEAGRQLGEFVAVRVPDPELARQAGEELAGAPDGELAVAILARLAQRDLAAEEVPHELDAVADAQHGHAE